MCIRDSHHIKRNRHFESPVWHSDFLYKIPMKKPHKIIWNLLLLSLIHIWLAPYKQATIIRSNYCYMVQELAARGIHKVDGIVLDLGVSLSLIHI